MRGRLMDGVLISKETIDSLLAELAKEYKRISGRKMHAEIIMVGGAAIVSQYGFRASTTDIDAIILASSAMDEAIKNVGEKKNLPWGWINQDFKKTTSYSPKIREYSKYYKTFYNILEVRVLPSAYIVAMKLASLRLYKYDISDIVGIISSESINREQIEKAVADLYGDFSGLAQPEKAEQILDNIFKSDNLEEMYNDTRKDEISNKAVLKNIQETNPDILKTDSISNILEAARRKKTDL